jgi:hypothetical protein
MKMEQIEGSCTVCFDDPFWIGVFECTYAGTYQVARVVFGPEPSDQEFFAFLTNHYDQITFSEPIKTESSTSLPRMGAKRSIRNARKETVKGLGTASQIALQRQRELQGQRHKKQKKLDKAKEEECRYLLRQQKRKLAKKGK